MTKKNRDYLQLPLEIKNVKTDEESEMFTFEGFAATFDNVDLVDDRIEKGAFEKSIKNRTPKLLMQHNSFEAPIGIISKIEENEKGLFIKAEMPKTDARVRDIIMPQMKVGSLDSMSIGFRVKDFDTEKDVRVLKEIEVHEISLVTFPANPKALVTGTKAEFGIADVEELKTKSEFEELLKSTGLFSRKAATKLASHFQEIKQSDSVDDNKSSKQSDSVKNVKTDLEDVFKSIIKLKK